VATVCAVAITVLTACTSASPTPLVDFFVQTLVFHQPLGAGG
jgi:hypothetical protein